MSAPFSPGSPSMPLIRNQDNEQDGKVGLSGTIFTIVNIYAGSTLLSCGYGVAQGGWAMVGVLNGLVLFGGWTGKAHKKVSDY